MKTIDISHIPEIFATFKPEGLSSNKRYTVGYN